MNFVDKILKISSVFLFLIILIKPLSAQDFNTIPDDYNSLLNLYETLLDEYEITINDYETLLNDYEELTIDYDKLNTNYKELNTNYDILNITYLDEIRFHEASKKSLDSAFKTIENLEISIRNLLSITDNKYFTLIPQIGYSGSIITGGLGFNIRIPKIPISIFLDTDFILAVPPLFNLQIGIGIRF